MKKLVVCLAVIVFGAINAYSAVYPGNTIDFNNNQIMQLVSNEVSIYDIQIENSDSEVVPENVLPEVTEEPEVQNQDEDLIDTSANAMGIGIF
jgi:hypothetical protein